MNKILVAAVWSEIMKKTAVVSLVLVILVGAGAAHGECAQAANYLDFSAEHEAPLIHCPDAFLSSDILAVATVQYHSTDWHKMLPSIPEKKDNIVLVAWFKHHPVWESLSHQDLFQFEEVYRL